MYVYFHFLFNGSLNKHLSTGSQTRHYTLTFWILRYLYTSQFKVQFKRIWWNVQKHTGKLVKANVFRISTSTYFFFEKRWCEINIKSSSKRISPLYIMESLEETTISNLILCEAEKELYIGVTVHKDLGAAVWWDTDWLSKRIHQCPTSSHTIGSFPRTEDLLWHESSL